MDILKRLNDAITYIEAHICDEIDMEELSHITLYTPDGFSRFFSYITGMTLNEYIRRRRLTLSAYELRESDIKVIDVALKYGYDSADVFTRAFIKQHGITPTKARSLIAPLKVYPPASFHIWIKGAQEMNFKIIETNGIILCGLSKQFSGTAGNRFEQEHIMWARECDDCPSKLCKEIPGVWYGIWDNGRYWVAKAKDEVDFDGLEAHEIPSGTYAVFTTGYGGFAGDELPKLREQIFDAWFADSGYELISDYEVEVYHLCSQTEKHKRYYEIWIPVQKKHKT
ncbi:AraC family transcriptional regulator [Sporomusa sp. KB1]|uniref:AraC family transcriptional regulator n=1 Tax=Sporomusa sp. KB1 TaxID=943346 RepID=UPI00119D2C9B|nr:AraC family transcriptional regulator [Sporomusa sp. KB1]TWH49419.1 AraC family transcriptional regulator [Sporomusa sp. KB1]